jgi:hypothetical protein
MIGSDHGVAGDQGTTTQLYALVFVVALKVGDSVIFGVRE